MVRKERKIVTEETKNNFVLIVQWDENYKIKAIQVLCPLIENLLEK